MRFIGTAKRRAVVVIVTDGMDNLSDNRPSDAMARADYLAPNLASASAAAGLTIRLARLGHTPAAAARRRLRRDLPKAFRRIADGCGTNAYSVSHRRLATRSTGSGHDGRPGLTVHARQMRVEISPVGSGGGIPAVMAEQPANVGRSDLQSASAPASAPASVPVSGARGALSYALDRFEAGEWASAIALEPARLMSIVTDGLKRDAPAWIAERGPSEVARRRLAVATYALTLLDSMTAPSLWQDQQPAANLLEATCTLLRQGEPTLAERLWFVGSLGVMERTAPSAFTLRHLAHAEARFPGDGRWALARVVAAEQQTTITFPNGTPMVPSGAARLYDAYKRASDIPAVHAEAETRWGYYAMTAGRLDEALKHFGDAGEPDDIVVRYWLHLFKGEAFERAQRVSDAVAGTPGCRRRALAQAAGFALASRFVTQRTSEAAALTLQMLNSDRW